MEQPLSGPASGLVITSTPAGIFVYWPDRKPADLTDENSRCVAYLDSLPFQEGTPLAPTEEHTSTEVATSDSSLGSPDRQVFMTTNETPAPSRTVPDRYLEDISADELSANAPADETDANRDTRHERNRKQNERRRHLRESLPIRNLAEALDQVESRMHTTPEQCLISITTITHQAQGCAREKSSPSLRRTPTSCESTTGSLKCPPRQEPPARQRSHKSQCGHRSQPYSRGATGQPQSYLGIGRWTLSWWQQCRRRRRQP
jgi:hypothetical protein